MIVGEGNEEHAIQQFLRSADEIRTDLHLAKLANRAIADGCRPALQIDCVRLRYCDVGHPLVKQPFAEQGWVVVPCLHHCYEFNRRERGLSAQQASVRQANTACFTLASRQPSGGQAVATKRWHIESMCNVTARWAEAADPLLAQGVLRGWTTIS